MTSTLDSLLHPSVSRLVLEAELTLVKTVSRSG